MTIHTVLLNWNQGKAAGDMVRRLRGWRTLPLRIHVVDNASVDPESARLGEDFPDIRLHRNRQNLGYAGGINTALKTIRDEAGPDDLVLLLNNDIEVDESCITTLRDALARDPGAGLAGPVLVEGTPDRPVRSWGGRNISRHLRTRRRQPPAHATPPAPFAVDYAPGTVLLFRAALPGRIGLLDEDYFFSGEIADYAARSALAGYTSLLVPAAEARHFGHDDHGQRDTIYRYYSLRNRFLFVNKYDREHAARLRRAWTATGLAIAAFCLLTGRPAAARATWMAVADGRAGRFGNQHERLRA